MLNLMESAELLRQLVEDGLDILSEDALEKIIDELEKQEGEIKNV